MEGYAVTGRRYSFHASFLLTTLSRLPLLLKILSILDMGFHFLTIEETRIFDYLSLKFAKLSFSVVEKCFLNDSLFCYVEWGEVGRV
jgi:hypothetical protein